MSDMSTSNDTDTTDTLFINLSHCIQSNQYDWSTLYQLQYQLVYNTIDHMQHNNNELIDVVDNLTVDQYGVKLSQHPPDDTNLSRSMHDNIQDQYNDINNTNDGSLFDELTGCDQKAIFQQLYHVFQSTLPYTNTSTPSNQSSIRRPYNGDLLILWLVQCMYCSQDRSTCTALLQLIQYVGQHTKLRISLRKLFYLFKKTAPIDSSPILNDLLLQSMEGDTYYNNSLQYELYITNVQSQSAQQSPVAKYGLKSMLLRVLQNIINCSHNNTTEYHSNRSTESPNVYWQSIDTPMFPRIITSIPPLLQPVNSPSIANSALSLPSTQSTGYTISLYVKFNELSDDSSNVFRYFDESGTGVQFLMRYNQLCIKQLPQQVDTTQITKNVLQCNVWYHIAITHKLPVQQMTTRANCNVAPPHNIKVNPDLTVTNTNKRNSTPSINILNTNKLNKSGKLSLYIDGVLHSLNDIEYPDLEQTNGLQCTLGGFNGCMGTFYLFTEVINSAGIYSMYTLGSSQYNQPAQHMLTNNSIAVFNHTPCMTSTSVQSKHSFYDDKPPHNNLLIQSRMVGKVALTQSPVQTINTVCLPDTFNEPATQLYNGLNNATVCDNHTQRLDGVNVIYTTDNNQSLYHEGGIKLLLHTLSPMCAAESIKNESEMIEIIHLLRICISCNRYLLHTILDAGACTIKSYFYDKLPKRYRTRAVLYATHQLLDTIGQYDFTADHIHYISYISTLLYDFTYWRTTSIDCLLHNTQYIQSNTAQYMNGFVYNTSVGLPRIIDNIILLYHNELYADVSSACDDTNDISINSPRSPAAVIPHSIPSPNNTRSRTSSTVDIPATDNTQHMTQLLEQWMSIGSSIAKHTATVTSIDYDNNILYPILHLIQLLVTRNAVHLTDVLIPILTLLLDCINYTWQKSVTYLYHQHSHVTLQQLMQHSNNDVCVLSLKLLCHLNIYYTIQSSLQSTAANIYSTHQSDLANTLYVVHNQRQCSSDELNVLYDIVFVLKPEQTKSKRTVIGSQTMPSKARKLQLNDTIDATDNDQPPQLSHISYIALLLQLCQLQHNHTLRYKTLQHILYTIQNNVNCVSLLAAEFWQPVFVSQLSYYNNQSITQPQQSRTADILGLYNDPVQDNENQSIDYNELDGIVYNIMDIILCYSLLHQQRGWQQLDQLLWCTTHTFTTILYSNVNSIHPHEYHQLSSEHRWIVTVHTCATLLQSMRHTFILLRGNTTSSGLPVQSRIAALDITSPISHKSITDTQITILRRNLPSVLELCEYIILHDECTFCVDMSVIHTSAATNTQYALSTNTSHTRTSSFAVSLSARQQAKSMLPSIVPGSARTWVSDDILSTDELQLCELLLVGVCYNLPVPEQRQVVLRLLFGYLTVILPLQACISLCTVICDTTVHVFTQRIGIDNSRETITERKRNMNLAQLAIQLLQSAQQSLSRLQQYTEQCNQLMTACSTLEGVWNTTSPSVRNSVTSDNDSPYIHDPEDMSTDMFGVNTLLSNATTQSKNDVELANHIIVQHHARLAYWCETRLRKIDSSVNEYIGTWNESCIVHNNELQSELAPYKTNNHHIINHNIFMLQCYTITNKQHTIQYKYSNNETQQLQSVNKLLAAYVIQNEHSRFRQYRLPMPIQYTNNSVIYHTLKQLYYLNQLRNTTANNRLYLDFSTYTEYWKLDSTESPTRMRRLIKKSFQPHHDNSSTTKHKPNTIVDIKQLKHNRIVKKNKRDEDELDLMTNRISDTPNLMVEPTRSGTEHNTIDDEDDDTAATDKDTDMETDIDNTVDDTNQHQSHATQSTNNNKKYKLSYECTLITPNEKYNGIIGCTDNNIYFHGESTIHNATKKHKSHKWSIIQIRMILPRFYLLRESAIELFFTNFKNYFINFTPFTSNELNQSDQSGQTQRNTFYHVLCQLCDKIQFELSPKQRLYKSGITKKWQNHEMSNFDYLMHLNTISGRTYNDIHQYPVFPWILTPYAFNLHTDKLDRTDMLIYRDLSKPIGALNESRLKIYEERYDNFTDDIIPKFYYGSHYSSAGIALYYLIRLSPYTQLNIELQNGTFDLPDRLFDSISGAAELSWNNLSDVKELIPEFFYLPDFLRNLNQLQFGQKQDKCSINDVRLPQWANTPEEFIRQHRELLESEHVSNNIHHWIDLIFGYKQLGENSIKYKNSFFYLTYAGSVDIDQIDDQALKQATIDQIAHFGQTPSQLLTTPHPRRYTLSECSDRALRIVGLRLPVLLPDTYTAQLLYQYLNQHYQQPNRIYYCDNNWLLSINSQYQCQTHNITRYIQQQSLIDTATVNTSETTGQYMTHELDSDDNQLNDGGMDTLQSNHIPYTIQSSNHIQIMCHHWLQPSTQRAVSVVTRNGQLMYTGGYIDHSIKVFSVCNKDLVAQRTHNITDIKPVSSVHYHNTVVTALSLTQNQSVLISGSLDGAIAFWRVYSNHSQRQRPPISSAPLSTYKLHHGTVLSIACDYRYGSLG